LRIGRAGVKARAMVAPLAVPRPMALARWLLGVAALVILMVVVGGITRLTESGLSITEWKPISGALPPLTEAQWQAEFAAYQRIPQYIEVNGPAGMTLAGFKQIFFWEWFHRLLGRLIGLAFALPLAWFWFKRAIPQGYHVRLLGLLALGGLQGAIGWWMVKSGLTQDVKVSHLRLATHLGLALTTLALLIWTALDLRAHAAGRPRARLRLLGALALAILWRAGGGLARRASRGRRSVQFRCLATDAGRTDPRRHRLVARPCARAVRRSLSGPFHPPLVGLAGGGPAGRAGTAGPPA
jgi:heme a synthase